MQLIRCWSSVILFAMGGFAVVDKESRKKCRGLGLVVEDGWELAHGVRIRVRARVEGVTMSVGDLQVIR
jgi:hypothetical protein